MIPFNPPMSNISGVTLIDHVSRPKSWFLQKMSKNYHIFWSTKMAIIQAKSFAFKKFSKKVEFFNIEQRKYQALPWKWTTLLRLFYSREWFAVAHLHFEKIEFLKEKSSFFLDKKLMFYKEMSVFSPFLLYSELWLADVAATRSFRNIWYWGVGRNHLKSSQLRGFGHRIITGFGGSKKTFFLCLVWVLGITIFICWFRDCKIS